MQTRRWSRCVSCLAAMAAAGMVSISAERVRSQPQVTATFVVNSTLDAVDANLGDAVCATAGGLCTLRAAIQETNALAGADIITLPAGTYNLTIPGATEGAAATGDLDISSSLTINGASATTTIIDANDLDRVFEFNGGGNYGLSGLTVRNGDAAATFGGGCIRVNAGNLALTASAVTGCTAPDGGGGIHIQGASTATITGTTISGNVAFIGGGINSNATVTVANSTISGNTATTSGGGGVSLVGAGSLMTLTNVTISGNSSGSGGAVAVGSSTQLNVRNSIVANSLGAGSANCANSGTLNNLGNNLEFPGTVCGFTSANPLLGALADNGGPTLTHALGSSSLAVDAGDLATCNGVPISGRDQRGTTRPAGLGCDIGAFELVAPFVVDSTLDAVDASPGNAVCATAGGLCTLRAAVQEANALVGAEIVTLPAGTYTLTIAGRFENEAATGDLDVNTSLTINGAGAATTFIDANALDRVFEFNGGGRSFGVGGVTVRNGNAGGFSAGGCISLTGGNLALAGSAVTGCTAGPAGGGIFTGSSTTSTISRTTVSGNGAAQGGGIDSQGTMTVANTTISGNAATLGSGGAIYFHGNTAGTVMTLVNVTIAANLSAASGAVVALGVDPLQVRNTIIANSAGAASANCSGTVASLSNNFEFPGTSCGFTSANPLLGALANNGGPTFTHAIDGLSPAFNSGDNATCAAAPVSGVDQRGTTRPQGAQCDIGAFEFDGPANTAPTITPIAAQRLSMGGTTGAIAFTIGDAETPGSLIVSSPTDTALVPNANIVFAGSGASRTVTVTLAAVQCGVLTRVTVTVADGGLSTSRVLPVLCLTDNVIALGVTTIQRAHILELRGVIDDIRVELPALSMFAWTNQTLTAGVTLVTAQDILDLRTALTQAYIAMGRTPSPTFTDATLAAVDGIRPAIKRLHIEEIRDAVIALLSP